MLLYNVHWRCQLWGTGARAPPRLPTVNFSGHFRAAQTLTMDLIWFPIRYPQLSKLACSFVTVYCMNFIILWCVTVTLKYFSFSFVPLLAPNPCDATDNVSRVYMTLSSLSTFKRILASMDFSDYLHWFIVSSLDFSYSHNYCYSSMLFTSWFYDFIIYVYYFIYLFLALYRPQSIVFFLLIYILFLGQL